MKPGIIIAVCSFRELHCCLSGKIVVREENERVETGMGRENEEVVTDIGIVKSRVHTHYPGS